MTWLNELITKSFSSLGVLESQVGLESLKGKIKDLLIGKFIQF